MICIVVDKKNEYINFVCFVVVCAVLSRVLYSVHSINTVLV